MQCILVYVGTARTAVWADSSDNSAFSVNRAQTEELIALIDYSYHQHWLEKVVDFPFNITKCCMSWSCIFTMRRTSSLCFLFISSDVTVWGEEELLVITCSSPSVPYCTILPLVAVMPCWLLRMRKLQTWVLASCSSTLHHRRAPHPFMCHSPDRRMQHLGWMVTCGSVFTKNITVGSCMSF